MLKEFLVILTMYLTVLVGHALHVRYNRWQARRKAEAEDRQALAPLSPFPADPAAPSIWPKHAMAVCVAVVAHPVTGETIKSYIIHFLIYSGYFLKGH